MDLHQIGADQGELTYYTLGLYSHERCSFMKSAYLYLFGAIVAEVIGTTALNASQGFTRWGPSAVTVAGYGLAFYLLSLTLKTIPVGITYAIWAGVGIVLISIVSWVFFKQRLDAPAVLGIALIIAGVVVINLFSRLSPHSN